ncbi:MAG TPA: hypothetical protein VJH88_04645 [Candidatus Nanoarchaeia archaeon]|nr:hypothetical protein [Candidatus Nanoarchaeia archaeon]
MISAALFFELAKIEGMLWSIADVLLIFSVLKLVNVIRKCTAVQPYKKLYYLLFFSFALTPLLLFVSNLFYFLTIEIIVLDIQYIIVIYVIMRNRGLMGKMLSNHL